MTTIKYSCGHEDKIADTTEVVLRRLPSEQAREELLKLVAAGACYNCGRNRMIETFNADVPPLEGTPRQIDYADKVRVRTLKCGLEWFIKNYFVSGCSDEDGADQCIVLYRIGTVMFKYAHVCRSSKWFLDLFSGGYYPSMENKVKYVDFVVKNAPLGPMFNINSEGAVKTLANCLAAASDDEILFWLGLGKAPEQAKDPEEAALKKEIEEASTLRPENPVSNVVTEISMDEEKSLIHVQAPGKLEELIEVVRELRFKWNPDRKRWWKKVREVDGDLKDRFIETGRKLLEAGIIIKIPSLDYIEDIEAGRYTPAYPRWITVSDKAPDRFLIFWNDDSFCGNIRRIPQARVWQRSATVPSVEYLSVCDFAEEYEFRFTGDAQALLEAAKLREKGQVVVKLKDGPSEIVLTPPHQGIPKLEAEEQKIADELKDGEDE